MKWFSESRSPSAHIRDTSEGQTQQRDLWLERGWKQKQKTASCSALVAEAQYHQIYPVVNYLSSQLMGALTESVQMDSKGPERTSINHVTKKKVSNQFSED